MSATEEPVVAENDGPDEEVADPPTEVATDPPTEAATEPEDATEPKEDATEDTKEAEAATEAATETETKEEEKETEKEEEKEVDLNNLEIKAPQDMEVFPWTPEFSKVQTEILRSAYTRKVLCDVVFVVGENDAQEEFLANRTIVSLGSEKLREIVFQENDETLYTEKNPKRVLWPNYSSRSVRAVVRYCYQLDPEIKSEFVLNLMHTCEDLGLDKLEAACARYVGMCLTGEQFCSLFEKAVLEQSEPIVLGCLEWLRKRPDEHVTLIKSDIFFSWHPEVFTKFIASPHLGVMEDDLWTAVRKWTETQKFMPVEEAVALALPQIRFPRMSPEFFVREVANKGVLDEDDCFSVLCRMHDANAPCRFSGESRAPCGPFIIQRYGDIGSTWNFNGRSKDSLQFQADKNCVLIAIGVNLATADTNSVCNFEVYDVASTTLIGKGTHDFTGVACPPVGEEVPAVRLEKSVSIKKNTWYQIQLQQQGGQGRQCQNCRERVEFEEAGHKITFRFQNHTTMMGEGDNNNNGTDRNSGQIPTLHVLFEV